MSACVLDASAVIAYLNDEPGSDTVETWLDRGSSISTLNILEVMARLVRDSVPCSEAREAIDGLGLEAIQFDTESAFEAGAMIETTRAHGLSHGDRACLALARNRRLPAVTGDRQWNQVADTLICRSLDISVATGRMHRNTQSQTTVKPLPIAPDRKQAQAR